MSKRDDLVECAIAAQGRVTTQSVSTFEYDWNVEDDELIVLFKDEAPDWAETTQVEDDDDGHARFRAVFESPF